MPPKPELQVVSPVPWNPLLMKLPMIEVQNRKKKAIMHIVRVKLVWRLIGSFPLLVFALQPKI